jgi:hypothetical protein
MSLLVFSFKQSSPGYKYLTLRTIEIPAGGYPYEPSIIIIYEDGQSEQIQLGKFKESNFLSNTKKINETINVIANKGYELFSVSGNDIMTSTYIFIKK